MKLYDDRLDVLPIAMFVGQRMKLPCITFKLGALSASRSQSGHVFRAKTDALGILEIRRALSIGFPTLVHPWVDFLLDRRPMGNTTDPRFPRIQNDSIGDSSSPPGPKFDTAWAVKQTRASSLIAQLGLPVTVHGLEMRRRCCLHR